MQLRSTLRWIGLAGLLLLVAGSAAAQDASHTFDSMAQCDGPPAACLQTVTAAAMNKCRASGCETCDTTDAKVDDSKVGRVSVKGTKCKDAPPATIGDQQKQQLTPEQATAQVESYIGRLQATRTAVATELAKAREARDVVKTLCLNDKLNQIDVAIRTISDRKKDMDAAKQANNLEAVGHHFTIITVLNGRVGQLSGEANQCIGEDIAFIGKTEVITQVDPTLPSNDLTDYPPTDVTIISAPPQCVSCNGK